MLCSLHRAPHLVQRGVAPLSTLHPTWHFPRAVLDAGEQPSGQRIVPCRRRWQPVKRIEQPHSPAIGCASLRQRHVAGQAACPDACLDDISRHVGLHGLLYRRVREVGVQLVHHRCVAAVTPVDGSQRLCARRKCRRRGCAAAHWFLRISRGVDMRHVSYCSRALMIVPEVVGEAGRGRLVLHPAHRPGGVCVSAAGSSA